MASFRKRNDKWQARITQRSHPDIAKTFRTRQDAEKWAKATELAIERGIFIDQGEAEKTTLAQTIRRYVREVLPIMKGAKDDSIRLNAICRRPICSYVMSRLSARLFAEYRDQRLREVSAGTVIRELAYLSSIINHARREWDININNPISLVRKPASPRGRDRVLSEDEVQRLLSKLEPTGRRNPWMEPLVIIALETAMRRGEILSLRWSTVNFLDRTAILADTKNGDKRIVPLSSKALLLLQTIPRHISGRVFPVEAASVSKAFEVAAKRAGLTNVRFHDLRHTAITRLSEKLPNLIELAAVSGHKSLSMLKRYYHPNATKLAEKLG
jgi:integrase